MNRLLTFTILLACAGLSPIAARADPYWITYEGNDFPENEGWTRTTYAGGAERWIEDGALVLDGREDTLIADSYSMVRSVDPDPGELFLMRCRLRVDEIAMGHSDPGLGVFSDESWSVGFRFSETRVFNVDDLGMSAGFEPGEFHVFELRSWDMRAFELRIDGSVALTGDFLHVITSSKVGFGDNIVGAASLSHWDYFEFGVVPEPSSGVATVAVCLLSCIVRRDDICKRG